MFSLSLFFPSLEIPQFGLLSHVSSLRLSTRHSGLVLTLRTDDEPTLPYPALAHCWWMQGSGLLLSWQLQLGAFSIGVPPPPVMLPFEIPKLHPDPPVRGFPTVWKLLLLHDSLPRTGLRPSLLTLFLSFLFCPTSFWREWAAFLGDWCPPSAFRCYYVEAVQYSNDLLMSLWGRKWFPHPSPLPSWNHLHIWIFLRLCSDDQDVDDNAQ